MREAAALALAAVLACARAAPALPPEPPPKAVVDKARALITLADKDRNGTVSLLEYAAAKLREANGGSAGNLRLTPKSDAYWRGLDADKDGAVSAEELSRGYPGDEFRAIDASRDGAIDADELAQALVKLDRAQGEEKRSGFVERYDADRDGKVERGEWPGCDEVFRRLDRNGDGVISAADQS